MRQRNHISTPTLEAETRRSMAQIDAQISALESQMPTAVRRDALAALRPDGCVCFGAGGVGRLIAIESGVPIFEMACPSCPEGAAMAAMVEDRVAGVQRVTDANRFVDQSYLDEQRGRWIAAAVVRAGLDHGKYDDRFSAFRRAAAPMSPELVGYASILERRFSERIAVPRGVFLYGPSGHGKTGLARCSGRVWIDQGRNALFIRAGDIFNRLYQGYSRKDGSTDALLEMLRTVPLLIVDDLGTERPTEHNRHHLLDLLLWRHNDRDRLVTLITSNYDIATTARRISESTDDDETARISGRLNEMCDPFEIISRDLRSAA